MGFPVVFAHAGIVMAHLLVNLPYAIRMIKTAFACSDERLEYIARTLGASRFRSFVTVLLPLCRTNLISTFILTWARAMGEFGGTLMLVGITRMKTETLPGSIYLSICFPVIPEAFCTMAQISHISPRKTGKSDLSIRHMPSFPI